MLNIYPKLNGFYHRYIYIYMYVCIEIYVLVTVSGGNKLIIFRLEVENENFIYTTGPLPRGPRGPHLRTRPFLGKTGPQGK
jgi:hypothetical protein